MTDLELELILQQAQTGDSEAFGVIYDEYSGRIYKFIFRRVGHKEVAEDVLSDTFLKAWQKLTQISSPRALSSWLYQIARNNVIDYYRLKREVVALEDVEHILEDTRNLIDEVNLSLEQKRILDLLPQLSTEQAAVVKYKFLEELENAEIAHIMDKTEGAIRVIQHRAIANLRRLLNKQ